MSTSALRRLGIALLLAILAVLAYRLAPRPGTTPALAPIRCDPGLQPCAAGLPGGGQLTLSIAPTPIRPLQRLEVRVTISGSPARARAVEFTGRDMDMGHHRAPLTGGPGQSSGQAMLPVCVSGRMEWLASVRISGAAGGSDDADELVVPFQLSVSGRPGAAP